MESEAINSDVTGDLHDPKGETVRPGSTPSLKVGLTLKNKGASQERR